MWNQAFLLKYSFKNRINMETRRMLSKSTVKFNIIKRMLGRLHKLIMMGLGWINPSSRISKRPKMEWSPILTRCTSNQNSRSNKNKLYKIHMKCIKQNQPKNNKNKLYKIHMNNTNHKCNNNHKVLKMKKKFTTLTQSTRRCRLKLWVNNKHQRKIT